MRHFLSAVAFIALLSAPAFAQEKETPKADVKTEAVAAEAPKAKDDKKTEAATAKKTAPKEEAKKTEAVKKDSEKKDAEKKEDTAKADVKTESVVKVPKKGAAKDTPVQTWINAENALIDPLSSKNKESFFILRNKYSVIRTIEVVKRDIGNAVKACGEKNPDIKEKMDTRFAEWKGAVEPIIDTAKTTLNKDIERQTIVDPAKAKDVFKLNDKAFEYSEKNIEKRPVTSKDACQSLVDSMDDTEDRMITLLQETLLPESVIKKSGEANKAAKKAE